MPEKETLSHRCLPGLPAQRPGVRPGETRGV